MTNKYKKFSGNGSDTRNQKREFKDNMKNELRALKEKLDKEKEAS